MRRLLYLVMLGCLSTLTIAVTHAKSVNYPAPDFVIKTHTQWLPAKMQQTKLSDLKGKVVYVDFWASWCVPCRRSFPWMNTMQSQFGEDLIIIAVNLDQEPHLATKFLLNNPANFHVEYNPKGDIAEVFDLIGMPSSYLIDKHGLVRVAHTGFFTNRIDQYTQSIASLIAE